MINFNGHTLCEFVIWWRHQMETFSALLAFCAGNPSVTCEFPSQEPVTRSFGVFFDLHLNKRLSKQSSGWWFEIPSHSLWRHCNEQPWQWFSSSGIFQFQHQCDRNARNSSIHLKHKWKWFALPAKIALFLLLYFLSNNLASVKNV